MDIPKDLQLVRLFVFPALVSTTSDSTTTLVFLPDETVHVGRSEPDERYFLGLNLNLMIYC
jgi:hypothetical protein